MLRPNDHDDFTALEGVLVPSVLVDAVKMAGAAHGLKSFDDVVVDAFMAYVASVSLSDTRAEAITQAWAVAGQP